MIDISPSSISPFTLTERFDPRAARLMMALAPTVPVVFENGFWDFEKREFSEEMIDCLLIDHSCDCLE